MILNGLEHTYTNDITLQYGSINQHSLNYLYSLYVHMFKLYLSVFKRLLSVFNVNCMHQGSESNAISILCMYVLYMWKNWQ